MNSKQRVSAIMTKSLSRIKEALYGSKIFFPVRSIYQFFCNRPQLKLRWERRDLYRQFIRAGDLVFDVGANMGTYAECFTELGARVVAIEPDPNCWGRLLRLARVRNVSVGGFAAGSEPGPRVLHLANNTQVSTLVPDGHPDWLQQKGRGTRETWVMTLDQVVERYGMPSFVKIDAEGYDDEVIRGMSFRPRALSFEYLLGRLDVALRCLQTLAHDGYEFNYVRGAETRLLGEWVSAGLLLERLHALRGEPHWGDVLACRIAKRPMPMPVPEAYQPRAALVTCLLFCLFLSLAAYLAVHWGGK